MWGQITRTAHIRNESEGILEKVPHKKAIQADAIWRHMGFSEFLTERELSSFLMMAMVQSVLILQIKHPIN